MNEAIRTQTLGEDQAEGLTFDLSQIDLERLRDEFAKKVRRKATALQDIRDIVEQKLAEMLARNPARMDYQRKYEEIVADYNREKDRTTVEETFRRLVELVNSLDEEQQRATKEGLSEDELALFDLLQKDGLDRTSRERVKQASRNLLASIKARLAELDRFWEKEQTRPMSRSSFWMRFLPVFRLHRSQRTTKEPRQPTSTPTFGNKPSTANLQWPRDTPPNCRVPSMPSSRERRVDCKVSVVFSSLLHYRGIVGTEDAVPPRQKGFLHEPARFDTARLVVIAFCCRSCAMTEQVGRVVNSAQA